MLKTIDSTSDNNVPFHWIRIADIWTELLIVHGCLSIDYAQFSRWVKANRIKCYTQMVMKVRWRDYDCRSIWSCDGIDSESCHVTRAKGSQSCYSEWGKGAEIEHNWVPVKVIRPNETWLLDQKQSASSSALAIRFQSPGPAYEQFGFMSKMEVPCTINVV